MRTRACPCILDEATLCPFSFVQSQGSPLRTVNMPASASTIADRQEYYWQRILFQYSGIELLILAKDC
eukprot:439026-Pelagomonas_calceolata.AAC.1